MTGPAISLRAAGARGMRHVLDFVTAPARPVPELPGQERVGGLIRRQMRRDVKDAHQPAYAVTEFRERQLAPRRRSRVGEGEEPIQPVAERIELSLRPVVRASADDRFARMEEKIQNGLTRVREIARKSDHVLERRVRRPQPAQCGEAAAPAARAESYTAAAPARRHAAGTVGRRRFNAAETGTSRTLLVPGAVALSYDRKYGVSGASTNSGPPLCNSENSGATLDSTR